MKLLTLTNELCTGTARIWRRGTCVVVLLNYTQ